MTSDQAQSPAPLAISSQFVKIHLGSQPLCSCNGIILFSAFYFIHIEDKENNHPNYDFKVKGKIFVLLNGCEDWRSWGLRALYKIGANMEKCSVSELEERKGCRSGLCKQVKFNPFS